MPPFVSRKRRLSTPSSELPTSKKAKKPDLSSATNSPAISSSVQEKKEFLDSLAPSDEDSSLSDASSSDFEDVLPAKKQKVSHDGSEDDEVDWEDALASGVSAPITPGPEPTGNLELTLTARDVPAYGFEGDKKKGPSKIEKRIRVVTHCMHVQFLMFHNAVRNAWASDKETQRILVEGLPQKVKDRVEDWRAACGHKVKPKVATEDRKGKGRQTNGRKTKDVRSQRDWGPPAERLEAGAPDLSHGDPTITLLRKLAAYWRKAFTITAPGLRKQGYKPVRSLEEEISSFYKDKHNHEDHGERIATLKEFRAAARLLEGSRDVGAQLFAALIRGLGIESRLVASLQPVGFGWSKAEEAPQKKKTSESGSHGEPDETMESGIEKSGTHDGRDGTRSKTKPTSEKTKTANEKPRPSQKSGRGGKDMPIDLSDTSELSDVASIESPSDAESIIDVTPAFRKKLNKRYDRDLVFPIYWTEVISPISHQVYPVDPMVLPTAVAVTAEQLSTFEPRGAKAEKAKQVMAYVIAHSSDGTAKDVTVRYLRKHIWPGKTKSYRMPIEKVPVYNKRGKIKRYEEFDWFKTVMSGYTRHAQLRTPADDIEDEKDLKPVKVEKKAMKEGEETLQGYKQSAEFVLERHLRREEALLEGAKPVKTFTLGKGDKEKEEPVFLRKDVVVCKTEESWHKEGRQVKPDEVALKHVPVRAVTITRKREMEDMTRRNDGVKPTQGLYSKVQTEWIIPPPIEDGVIPKNKYGNMDCFVPSMVPKGAVHVPLRGTVRVCKKLGIDYAEAVTGFEFGNKMAVPVCQGVIVAAENENALIDAWEREEEIRRMKEDEKRAKLILGTWRKFLMGLRIVERVKEEYGEDLGGDEKDSINPFTNPQKFRQPDKSQPQVVHDVAETNDQGGGFLREGEEEDLPVEGEFEVVDPSNNLAREEVGGGFLSDAEDDILEINVENSSAAREEQKRSTAGIKQKKPTRNNVTNGYDGTMDTDDDSSTLSTPSLASESSGDDMDSDFTRKPPRTNGKSNITTPRTQPRRSRVANSANHTRSRYFEHETVSASDEDDHVEEGPKARRKRGRPAGTAKGSGSKAGKGEIGEKKRGRGRPRKTI